MFRRFVIALAAMTAIPFAVSCFSSSSDDDEGYQRAPAVRESPPLPPGHYAIQSMAYDDADGAYRVFLLDAPVNPLVSTHLRMARAEEGAAAAVDVDAEGPVAKLPADFAIQYVHNVTEDVVNPRTGQSETVVVRQESSTWSPFMAGLAGAAIGNMLFSPMYYYPPPYVRGAGLVGFGGYGATRIAAQQSFVSKHGALPQPAKLSQSGYAKKPSSTMKPTGSGAGSSRIQKKAPSPSPSRRSFGTGRRRR